MRSKAFEVYTQGNGKKSRAFKKFPRATVNKLHEDCDKVSMRGTYKHWGWDTSCWERFPHGRRGQICRFLQSHLGENIDKIYSEYINKLKEVHTKNNLLSEADYNWHDTVYIPGETPISDRDWCPFSIDSEKRLILNPDKNHNWHIGRW